MAHETFDLQEFDWSEQVADAYASSDEWLDQALHRVDAIVGEGITVPKAICAAGFMIASGLSYLANSQVQAAKIHAKAILDGARKADSNG